MFKIFHRFFRKMIRLNLLDKEMDFGAGEGIKKGRCFYTPPSVFGI